MEALFGLLAVGFLALFLFFKLVEKVTTSFARMLASGDPRTLARLDENILRRDIARKFGAHALPDDVPVTRKAIEVQASAPRFVSTIFIAIIIVLLIFVIRGEPKPAEIDFYLGLYVMLPIVWLCRRLIWRRRWKREVRSMLKTIEDASRPLPTPGLPPLRHSVLPPPLPSGYGSRSRT